MSSSRTSVACAARSACSENWLLKLPPNFMACGVVPQLDVLPLCDAFLTHGGMGSVMEALLHRVPLAVIPVFGDQIWNADRAGAAGLGRDSALPGAGAGSPVVEVGPRMNFSTAWSSNAVSICRSCGVSRVSRIASA